MKRLLVAWLPDGKRLHLKNGHVNMIVQAFGRPGEVGRAYDAAIARARELVFELGEDLPRLYENAAPQTIVARRAAAACAEVPGALAPVTALTGAVADEVLGAMVQAGQLDRGFANNHGAVALHVAQGQSLSADIVDWPEYRRYEARVPILYASRTRGLAASGWNYDRFALGCVDRIFTAAPTAAVAEAGLGAIASAMVAQAGAKTVPASALEPQSILGLLPVFPPLRDLEAAAVTDLIARGREVAAPLYASGIITLALMSLAEEYFFAAPPQFSLRSMLSLEV